MSPELEMYWNLLILLLFSLVSANSKAVVCNGEEISDASDFIIELINVSDYHVDIEFAEDCDFDNTTCPITGNNFIPQISKAKVWCKRISIKLRECLHSSDLSPPNSIL